MNQEEISQLPGAYEFAFCDQYRKPISPWLWIAPRTMFDDEIKVSFVSEDEQLIAGVVGRDGQYRRIKWRHLPAGSTFVFTAGTKESGIC